MGGFLLSNICKCGEYQHLHILQNYPTDLKIDKEAANYVCLVTKLRPIPSNFFDAFSFSSYNIDFLRNKYTTSKQRQTT